MRSVWINVDRERLVLKLKCKKTIYNKYGKYYCKIVCVRWTNNHCSNQIQPKLQINNWTFTLEFWKYFPTYLLESLREIKIVIFKKVFYKPNIKKDQLSHKYKIKTEHWEA